MPRGGTEDVNDAGLDLGLNHSYLSDSWSMINRLSVVPAFNDFGNFRLIHESYFEIPLTDPKWKVRVGLNNDYNSRSGAGLEKLDTTYFSRLVLNWR